ncbi:hypothetical protein L3Y34_012410 [Caenorhabditis briggsae]|uniref:Uncharacterized protein n=1 Tax=Caenorhabditis briggsae TaxID=6238 RepID=A0AAE8ZYW9_CAEBR|nr:hypothetical protein L3Y34_012410 [Caenorhabditis briggsae]
MISRIQVQIQMDMLQMTGFHRNVEELFQEAAPDMTPDKAKILERIVRSITKATNYYSNPSVHKELINLEKTAEKEFSEKKSAIGGQLLEFMSNKSTSEILDHSKLFNLHADCIFLTEQLKEAKHLKTTAEFEYLQQDALIAHQKEMNILKHKKEFSLQSEILEMLENAHLDRTSEMFEESHGPTQTISGPMSLAQHLKEIEELFHEAAPLMTNEQLEQLSNIQKSLVQGTIMSISEANVQQEKTIDDIQKNKRTIVMQLMKETAELLSRRKPRNGSQRIQLDISKVKLELLELEDNKQYADEQYVRTSCGKKLDSYIHMIAVSTAEIKDRAADSSRRVDGTLRKLNKIEL